MTRCAHDVATGWPCPSCDLERAIAENESLRAQLASRTEELEAVRARIASAPTTTGNGSIGECQRMFLWHKLTEKRVALVEVG